jgi:ABC-type nitrate/sulfonate/bicarbonate transport system substrate-binding protein
VHAVAWLAVDGGHFERRQLKAQVDVMGGSAAAMRTLIAGGIDIALAGGDAALKAHWAGADLVVVAGFVERFYHRIVARAPITKLADLSAKKLGLPFLGGPQDMAARYALETQGLVPGKDVALLNLGKETNLIAALTRGEIDATTSDLPASRLAALGLSVIADLPAEPYAFPYIVVVVHRRTLESQRSLVAEALAGLCDAAEKYTSDEEPAVALLTRRLRISDPALAREQHAAAKRLLLKPPLASRKAFENVIRLLGRGDAERRQLGRFLDATVLESVRAKGHCS